MSISLPPGLTSIFNSAAFTNGSNFITVAQAYNFFITKLSLTKFLTDGFTTSGIIWASSNTSPVSYDGGSTMILTSNYSVQNSSTTLDNDIIRFTFSGFTNLNQLRVIITGGVDSHTITFPSASTSSQNIYTTTFFFGGSNVITVAPGQIYVMDVYTDNTSFYINIIPYA